MSVQDLQSRKRHYADKGFRFFSSGTCSDAQSFFSNAKAVLPLDPPISGSVNWDAFRDSLYGGLDASTEQRIAIVVDDASVFRTDDPVGFETACECLFGSAAEIEQDKISDGERNFEVVVLVGVELAE